MSFAEQYARTQPWNQSRVITLTSPKSTTIAILSLVASDLMAATLTLLVVYLITRTPPLIPWLLAGFLGFWVSLFIFGLYPGRGLFGPERVRRRTILALMAFLPTAAVCVLWVSDWGIAALQFALAPIGIIFFGCLFEVVTISILIGQNMWMADAVVVGELNASRNVQMDLKLFPELGLRSIDAREPHASAEGVRLMALSDSAAANEYLVDASSPLPAFYSVQRPPNNMFGVSNGAASCLAKRIIDFGGAFLLLVFTSPLLLLAAILILATDGRPVFFRQKRGGLNGGEVRVWKLRSMYRDAPDRLESVLASDPNKRAEWNQYFKLREDPRILPLIGNFIRRTSIDELPQLWNVLRGEMSLVGPRPFPENHLNAFSQDFCDLRHRVLPGITGLWQVTLRSDGDLEMQERLDSSYVLGWSIWLDLYILFRTPIVLLSSRGAR